VGCASTAPVSARMQGTNLRPPEIEAIDDYYTVLARMVEAVNEDNFLLRAMIYELARVKLRKEICQNFREVGWSGIYDQLRALDAAIDRFEADSTDNVGRLNDFSQPERTQIGRPSNDTHGSGGQLSKTLIVNHHDASIQASSFAQSANGGKRILSLPEFSARDGYPATARAAKHLRPALWSTIQLVMAAVLGVALYAALQSQIAFLESSKTPPTEDIARSANATDVPKAETKTSLSGTSASSPSETNFRPITPQIPVPSTYGVYAVSDGKLIDLGLLPIRVPDSRIAISSSINAPSHVHLPVGKLQFVVFRRDLVNDMPDRVELRVVARVVRALTFGSASKPTISDVTGSWVVRSNSYQLRVAPVDDHPEMVLLRTERPDLVFPAGRYALVLKNLAYDFTLDGTLTDLAHCLERTDGLPSPIYTECRDL
jgi:hypothetical protein